MNLRNLAIWGVIVVLLVSLYGVLNRGGRQGGPAPITYSQLLNRVDAGRIKAATIHGEIVEARDSDGKTYTTVTPANQDDLLKRLGAHNADIDVKPANQVTLLGVLVNSLPIQLHPEVASTVTINVARSTQEAERQTRGEELNVREETSMDDLGLEIGAALAEAGGDDDR